MTLNEIYKLAIRLGIEKDPRGKKRVQKYLNQQRKSFAKLTKKQKQNFDKENLTNPYSDTRILHGKKQTRIEACMVGIDIEVSEILLADRLKQAGKKIDLIISHHPIGKARAGFYEVMDMQTEVLKAHGITKDVAESLMKERIKEVERKVSPGNFERPVDAARLLGIPLICMHTPTDNFVNNYIQKLMDTKRPKKVGDILRILEAIPEYKSAILQKSGPKVIAGNEKNKAGKIFVDMTGGTEGSKDVFARLSQAGIDTIVAMHLSEGHFKSVNREHINVVIAGHISSDALGLNLFLDQLQKKTTLDIITCSGFNRVRRKK